MSCHWTEGLPCWGWWLIWTTGHREAEWFCPSPGLQGRHLASNPLSAGVGHENPLEHLQGALRWRQDSCLSGVVAHTLGG